MLRIDVDALRPDERAQLEACITATRREEGAPMRAWRPILFMVLGLFVVAPAGLALSWLVGWHNSLIVLLVGPTAGAALGYLSQTSATSRRDRRLVRLEEDLGRGEAEVLEVETTRAASVGGDKRSRAGAIVFDVGGGALLYVQGPVLEDAPESLPREMTTVRVAPSSRIVLGIESRGRPLEPVRDVSPLAAWRRGYSREDRAFFVPGALEDLGALIRSRGFLRQLRGS